MHKTFKITPREQRMIIASRKKRQKATATGGEWVDIKNARELSKVIRGGGVQYGGYNIFFFDKNGGCYHFNCVKDNLAQHALNIKQKTFDALQGYAINYEDKDMYCEECNELIEPEYGD